jgi:hypothetical protein
MDHLRSSKGRGVVIRDRRSLGDARLRNFAASIVEEDKVVAVVVPVAVAVEHDRVVVVVSLFHTRAWLEPTR